MSNEQLAVGNARPMKDSGVEWIGEIPEEWQTSKLKYLGRYINGYAFKPEDWGSEGVQIIRIQDLTGSNDNPNYYNEEIDRKYLVENGDILVSWAATLDAFIWNKGKGWLNQHIFKAIPNLEIIDYNFFFWMIKESMKNMNNDNKHGIFMQHVTLDVFNNFSIPLPSLAEQRRIADFLDAKCAEIDRVVAETEKTIEEYKALRQSVITEAVTKGVRGKRPMKDSGIEWIGEIPEEWEVTKFKNLGSCRNGLTYSPENQCGEEGTLVLRSSNIQNGMLDFSDCVYVNCPVRDELMVKPNDILICSRNGSAKLIGKNAIIPQGLTATFGAFMMIYRCQNPEYMQFILSSHIFSYYLGTFLTVSVNQLTGKNFDNIQFPYTKNSEEQEEIIAFLNKKCTEIDKLIATKQKLLAELESYKKSVIYEYVTGKKEVPACQ